MQEGDPGKSCRRCLYILEVRVKEPQHISAPHGVHLLVCEFNLRATAVPGTVLNCLSVNHTQGSVVVLGMVYIGGADPAVVQVETAARDSAGAPVLPGTAPVLGNIAEPVC